MPKRPANSSRPPRPAARPQPRARLWVDIHNRPGITEPGADLLEQIIATGSLSAAARKLRFSYRRAWLLLNAMNLAWQQPVATSATGGRSGGGAQLTPFGFALLAAYRHLQLQLEFTLDHETSTFTRALSPHLKK